VIDGVPDHRDSVLTDSERQVGDCVMICVSRARTSRLVLDLQPRSTYPRERRR
jgi:hypothetical protein